MSLALKKQKEEHIKATPILKWAGGKSQLLPILNVYYPRALKQNKIKIYIEPFVGGGAVFFDIVSRYNIESAFLFDINPELVTLYNSVKSDLHAVITYLEKFEETYLSYDNEERKNYFYKVREEYNKKASTQYAYIDKKPNNAYRSAQTIFLNRTCFNGLYRVNSNGHFNVPIGKYKNPTILFEKKLVAASKALSIANIKMGDFKEAEKHCGQNTFIYYDPPYRPISKTAQFTAYAADDFDDSDQIRLAKLFDKIHQKGTLQMLSNSDPTNYCDDPFFDNLYEKHTINRIDASRRINSNAEKRGTVRELLITNYAE